MLMFLDCWYILIVNSLSYDKANKKPIKHTMCVLGGMVSYYIQKLMSVLLCCKVLKYLKIVYFLLSYQLSFDKILVHSHY